MVEQVIRPTGSFGPGERGGAGPRPGPALVQEIKERAARGERVLITTLTKRLAEDLSRYLKNRGFAASGCIPSSTPSSETILRELAKAPGRPGGH